MNTLNKVFGFLADRYPSLSKIANIFSIFVFSFVVSGMYLNLESLHHKNIEVMTSAVDNIKNVSKTATENSEFIKTLDDRVYKNLQELEAHKREMQEHKKELEQLKRQIDNES